MAMSRKREVSFLTDTLDEDGSSIEVNEAFASAYNARKQAEELRRDDYSSDDSSSDSEDEDETGVMVTPSLQAQFLSTLQALQTKDSAIYDERVRFFASTPDSPARKSVSSSSDTLRFKDVIRNQLLSADDESTTPVDTNDISGGLLYDEEQKALRDAFIAEANESEDTDSPDFLVAKQDLARAGLEPSSVEDCLNSEPGNDAASSPNSGDAFLLDYIKNEKWRNKAGEETEGAIAVDNLSCGSTDSVDVADDFEAAYNFRFEEASKETGSGALSSMTSFARGQTIQTLRRKDDSRRLQRLAKKERKAAERRAKEEQLKRLKNIKKKQVERQLDTIKKFIGSRGDQASFDESALLEALEGDFNPDRFDELMHSTFGDSYYEQPDPEWEHVDGDGDEASSLNLDLLGASGEVEGVWNGARDHYSEADSSQHSSKHQIPGNNQRRNASLENRLRDLLQEKVVGVEHEDIVGGMPTRFKYKKVEPNSYGLSTEEILLARDSTLRQHVSLKKMAPYRESGEYSLATAKRRRFQKAVQRDIEEQSASFLAAVESSSPKHSGNSTRINRKRRRLKKKKA